MPRPLPEDSIDTTTLTPKKPTTANAKSAKRELERKLTNLFRAFQQAHGVEIRDVLLTVNQSPIGGYQIVNTELTCQL